MRFLVFGGNPPKIDAQMFFWSGFLKMHKKVIAYQKRHFGRFWRLIKVLFLCVFKNTYQNNSCVSIVLKAKTEKKLIDPKKGFF